MLDGLVRLVGSRVEDEDVDGAELRDDLRAHPLDVRLVDHVAAKQPPLESRALIVRETRLSSLPAVAVVDCDGRSRVPEREGHGAAEPLAASRDERDLPIEAEAWNLIGMHGRKVPPPQQVTSLTDSSTRITCCGVELNLTAGVRNLILISI